MSKRDGIPDYIAPWGNDGDRSAWAGTLWPIYTTDFDDKPFPAEGWELDRELDDWRGVPRWVKCVNGRTIMRVVHSCEPGSMNVTSSECRVSASHIHTVDGRVIFEEKARE